MIIFGVVLLILGLVLGLSVLWTIGVVLVTFGVIFAILGSVGHGIGGRRHYY